MSELKQATKRALVWSFLDRFWQQALTAVAGIITLRLIAEDNFGIIASLAIFTSLASILSESGMSMALIRKTDAAGKDYSTAFYFNITVAVLIFGLLFISAPMIGRFYDDVRIVAVARVLFISVIFNAAGSIQSTILIKRMDFRRLMTANAVAVAVACCTSVAMAFAGYGVWALAAQQVLLVAVKSVMLWLSCRWVPREKFSVASFREMFGFSSKLLVSSLVNSIYANFYSSAISRYFGLASGGIYNQANKIKEAGTAGITNIFASSTYSMLANVQDDPERCNRAMRKTVRTISFVAFPAMLGLALVAEPAIRVAVTERWIAAVPLLQVLCCAGLFFILNSINGNFIKISGRSAVLMRLEIAGAVMLIAFLFISVRYGLFAAVCADAVSKAILFGLYLNTVSRLMGYRVREQLLDIAPYAVISIAMISLLYPLKYIIHDDVPLLAAQIVGGVLFYWGANRLLGSKILDEVIDTIKNKK